MRPHFAHQCARRRAAANNSGGQICLLRELRPDDGGELVRGKVAIVSLEHHERNGL